MLERLRLVNLRGIQMNSEKVAAYIKQRKSEVAKKYLSCKSEYEKHINLTEFIVLMEVEKLL